MVTAARAYIGRFPDEVAAARAYDAFVIANNLLEQEPVSSTTIFWSRNLLACSNRSMHQHLRAISERKRARVEDEEQQEARVPRDLADPRRKRIRVRRSSAVSMRFRGVCWDKRGKKWRVRITVGSKTKHIGRFIDKIEAARAYDAYAIANGIDAPRNFREDDVVAGAARGGGRFFDQQSQRWLAVRVTVGGKRPVCTAACLS